MLRRRSCRLWPVLVLVAGIGCWGAAPASAVEAASSAGCIFIAEPGQDNSVRVTAVEGDDPGGSFFLMYTITDSTGTLNRSCFRDLRGDGPEETDLVVEVWLGDGDDRMSPTSVPGRVDVHGGPGTDALTASKGDVLLGDAGDDTLVGGTAYGGDGNDVIRGTRIAYGNAGNDTILGRTRMDFLYGGPGADLIRGGKGNDTIYGNSGNDTLYGNSGNDTISGGPGKDTLAGGPGHDRLHQ